MTPYLPPPSLLLVSDDPASLADLTRALERRYRLQTSPFASALSQIGQGSVQVVLVHTADFTAGLALLASIRRQRRSAELPVILLAGEAAGADVAHALRQGANEVLTAPLDTEVAQARIERQLAIGRELDERQAAINALQAANDQKDQFLRIAVHDLKTPLNTIRLAQYFLRGTIGDDPSALDALDAIEETVLWMNALIEDYLDAARLRSGRAELHIEPVLVDEIVWNVVNQYALAAERKNIILQADLPEAAEAAVLADARRLLQIIANLVSNAIKYSPPGSTVTITAETRGSRVRISVADQGPGIPPEERSQLFTAFGQLSPQPTGGESSTGLGLWIVKELAEIQRAQVGVICPPDGGSIFWVEFPVAREPHRLRH